MAKFVEMTTLKGEKIKINLDAVYEYSEDSTGSIIKTNIVIYTYIDPRITDAEKENVQIHKYLTYRVKEKLSELI